MSLIRDSTLSFKFGSSFHGTLVEKLVSLMEATELYVESQLLQIWTSQGLN